MEASEREDTWLSEGSSPVTLAVEWNGLPHEISVAFPLRVEVLMDLYCVFRGF